VKKNKSKKSQSGSLGALPILVGLAGAVLAAGHGKDMFKKFRVGKAVERLKSDSVVKHIKDIKLVKQTEALKKPMLLDKERLLAERAAHNRRAMSKAKIKTKPGTAPSPKPAPKPGSVINFEEAKKRHLKKLSTVISEDCFMNNFWSGFEKRASGLSTAAELGGLGTLAIPSIQELRGKPMDEKTKARLEVLGLGTLAAPYAAPYARKGFQGAGNLAKNISRGAGNIARTLFGP
jgi:hypothetical protein